MGWKASMIIIENRDNFGDNQMILKTLGTGEYAFEKEWSLEECIQPGDRSVSIGYYNNNIIICDDYQITSDSLEGAKNLDLTQTEQKLCTLFPASEIITVSCHSAINYHGYSVIENGIKKRLKVISSETPKVEFGQRVPEEEKIYESSYQIGEDFFWKDDNDDDYAEDQLMEDFTFGMAKRRLGVAIDDDELFREVKFRKYINPAFKRLIEEETVTTSEEYERNEKAKIWRTIIITTIIVLLWQAIKRVFN